MKVSSIDWIAISRKPVNFYVYQFMISTILAFFVQINQTEPTEMKRQTRIYPKKITFYENYTEF